MWNGRCSVCAPGEIGYLPFENCCRQSDTITTNPVGTHYYGDVYSYLIDNYGQPLDVDFTTYPDLNYMIWGHPRFSRYGKCHGVDS